ncbi:hypothetical protein, partial [Angelakisella massiliensis]|uniref:hypothetical protein n=1 Tax=Angelakisella massiliensis TaxID=1871018 RepID=UPI0024B0D760
MMDLLSFIGQCVKPIESSVIFSAVRHGKQNFMETGKCCLGNLSSMGNFFFYFAKSHWGNVGGGAVFPPPPLAALGGQLP